MFARNYSVRIVDAGHPNNNFKEQDGYVRLRDGQQYALHLRNYSNRRSEATVSIDGKPVGTWILNAKESITLTRPVHDDGHFTFYRTGSVGFAASELGNVSEDLLGLITITFTPERLFTERIRRVRDRQWSVIGTMPDWGSATTTGPITTRGLGGSWGASGGSTLNNAAPARSPCNAAGASASAPGGTGLSGHSGQQYVEVPGLVLDTSEAVTINLRLVSDESGARPLTRYSTPVPPPIRVH